MTVVRRLYFSVNSVPNACFIGLRFFWGPPELLVPQPRLLDAPPNEGDEERRQSTEDEHPAPALIRADEVVGERREEEPEVVAGVQDARPPSCAGPRAFLGHEGRSDRLLAPEPDPAQYAKHRQLPDVGHEPAEKREQRVGRGS